MFKSTIVKAPQILPAIEQATKEIQFPMSSEPLTGMLLRALAAGKPGGNILEIGTGTGMGSAWLLAGMDSTAQLISVDKNEKTSAIAQRFLGDDPRLTLVIVDADHFILSRPPETFDLIFADTWPGKFYLLDETLALLKKGGQYVIDDLLPQQGWPEDQEMRVDQLITILEQRDDIHITGLDWASGILIATKI